MTLLSRFSMNSVAATRAVICMARCYRSGVSSADKRNLGPHGPVVRSFGHFIRVRLWESAAKRSPCSMGRLAYLPMSSARSIELRL